MHRYLRSMTHWMEMVAIAGLVLAYIASPLQSQPKPADGIIVSALYPASLTQGSTNLLLTVRGKGFSSKSQIRIDDEHRSTSFVSSSELRTVLLPADVATARTSRVVVFTPGIGSTRDFPLKIAPAPTMSIATLTPANAIPGAVGTSFRVAIRGAGFTSGMRVRWNGVERSSAFLAPSIMSVPVSSADIASPGTANITVLDVSTGSETPATLFYIDAARSPVPRITILGRNTTVAGAAFETSVNGDGFVLGSVVRVNGVAVPATNVGVNGSFIIGVTIPASMIATPGTYQITVFNAGISNGESNAVSLTVTAQ